MTSSMVRSLSLNVLLLCGIVLSVMLMLLGQAIKADPIVAASVSIIAAMAIVNAGVYLFYTRKRIIVRVRSLLI